MTQAYKNIANAAETMVGDWLTASGGNNEEIVAGFFKDLTDEELVNDMLQDWSEIPICNDGQPDAKAWRMAVVKAMADERTARGIF